MITPEQHIDETIYELILEIKALNVNEKDKVVVGSVAGCLEEFRESEGCGHFNCRMQVIVEIVSMIMNATDVPKIVKDTVKRVFERANDKVKAMISNG